MIKLEFQFRALQASDDRSKFSCGAIELDRYFQQYAGQNQFRHHIGITYIFVADTSILGFVTVSAGELATEKLPTDIRYRLPEYPIPIMRIARLAIDKQFQGLGLGKKLLRSSFQLALEMKSLYGCAGIVVDAKLNSLGFYQKIGFVPLQTISGELGNKPEPQPLFLSIKSVEQAFS